MKKLEDYTLKDLQQLCSHRICSECPLSFQRVTNTCACRLVAPPENWFDKLTKKEKEELAKALEAEI